MLTLLPPSSFPAVRSEIIERYAHDQVRSGRWQVEGSIAMAETELDRLLPQGVSTPFHDIYEIRCTTTGQVVGTLWTHISESGGCKSAFICDLHVAAAFRRRGYARQALIELETVLAGTAVSAMALHAFSHNAGAIALYEKLGFRTTSVNMHKPLNRR